LRFIHGSTAQQPKLIPNPLDRFLGVIASSSPAGRPALLDENPSCGELNGVFFVSKSAFSEENARHTGSNFGVSVASFLPSEAKQSMAKSPMLPMDRHGGFAASR
jgi:hypothetical protein